MAVQLLLCQVLPPGLVQYCLQHSCTIARYGDAKWTYNIHIYITWNIGSRNTKNTYDFFVQVQNFLLPLSLKGSSTKGERGTIFLSWLFNLPPPTCVASATKVSASKRKPTSPEAGLYSTNFLQISKILSALPVRDVIRTL